MEQKQSQILEPNSQTTHHPDNTANFPPPSTKLAFPVLGSCTVHCQPTAWPLFCTNSLCNFSMSSKSPLRSIKRSCASSQKRSNWIKRLSTSNLCFQSSYTFFCNNKFNAVIISSIVFNYVEICMLAYFLLICIFIADLQIFCWFGNIYLFLYVGTGTFSYFLLICRFIVDLQIYCVLANSVELHRGPTNSQLLLTIQPCHPEQCGQPSKTNN